MMSCCFGGGSQRVDSSDSKKPVVEKIEVRPGTGQEPRNGSNEDGGGSQDGSGAQPISVANWMKSLLQSPEPRRNPETAWLKENMQPGNVEDKYITKKVLGKGAYASVWSSINKHTREYCAMKCIDFEEVSRDKIDKTIAQLSQETRLHLQLTHKAIMHLEEFYLTGTKMFIILEIMRGGSLLDLILERGGLKEGEAKLVFREVFEGLEHMHSKNIIHRDIKLENMMLGEVNDLRSVKIADFGFAIEIATDEDKAKISGLAGTPVYMAPEAVDVMMGQKTVTEALTPGLDMWAAGVALYMLVGGYPPFEGKSSKEIFKNIYKANVAFKEPSWRNVSDDCISLLNGLLQRKQKDRLTATQALKHKWFKEAVVQEDLSKTLAQSVDGGPRVMVAMDRLERLTSTKLDDSMYIKKSLLLEIQERHNMSLGAGMDHSLMRIFSENKQKLKTAQKKKPKKKKEEPEAPLIEQAPEVAKTPSIGTLIGQVAGPPRYDALTEFEDEGDDDDDDDDMFDPSMRPRVSPVLNDDPFMDEGESSAADDEDDDDDAEPEKSRPSVTGVVSRRTTAAAAMAEKSATFAENPPAKPRAFGAAAAFGGGAAFSSAASSPTASSPAGTHRSMTMMPPGSSSPQLPEGTRSSRASRVSDTDRQPGKHPLLPDNYYATPAASTSPLGPGSPTKSNPASLQQEQEQPGFSPLRTPEQNVANMVQGDVLGNQGTPGAARIVTPPIARGGW